MKWMVKIAYLLIFVLSMALIVMGQRNIGPVGLLTMIAGLAGILLLLFLYNRKFQ
ncbi:MAG: hypothetical protein HFI52_11805 [Lachnospiraceae bacterium]|nr:hypothetical protein [Lachnospiraceae bacterium]